jgi:hypothetical protein
MLSENEKILNMIKLEISRFKEDPNVIEERGFKIIFAELLRNSQNLGMDLFEYKNDISAVERAIGIKDPNKRRVITQIRKYVIEIRENLKKNNLFVPSKPTLDDALNYVRLAKKSGYNDEIKDDEFFLLSFAR